MAALNRGFAAVATITELKKGKRAVAIVAQVRIKPFKACQKTFRVVTTKGSARKLAVTWGKAEEKRLREEFEKGQSAVIKDLSRYTVGSLINEYLEESEVQALGTFKDIDRMLAWWLKRHVTTRVLDFNVLVIRAARKELREEKPTTETANRYLSVMRRCWNWGRNSGLIPNSHAWPDDVLFSSPEPRKLFLTAEQLDTLLKVADSDQVMRTAIIVSIGTGVRLGELLRLQWKDINFDEGSITLLKTKNKTPRAVHLPSNVASALRTLKKATVQSLAQHVFLLPDGRPLKTSVLEKRWRKIRKSAFLAHFHWHDLRHSCASFLAASGASQLEIAEVLGHKSLAMVKRYAHLTPGKAVRGHAELDSLLGGKP
ncbi:MAG TPA: site-specific integrase [Steroidobacteraceae bacterium]|jgi:integrase|nr:site-specific integrase [Steroidobacteraceae bacterium]